MSSLLEGLPRTKLGGWAARLELGFPLLFLAGGAVAFVGVGLGAWELCAFGGGSLVCASFASFVSAFVAAAIGGRHLGLAEQHLRAGRMPEALAEAKQAVRWGPPARDGGVFARSWLVVARCAIHAGALDDAAEALRRSAFGFHSRASLHAIVTEATLLRAFVDAARGSAVELSLVGEVEPHLHADLVRARIMIAFRRGQHRETIDMVDRALVQLEAPSERDRALFTALRASAMLRLASNVDGHHPMRVASDAVGHLDATDHEAWLDAVLPDRARSA